MTAARDEFLDLGDPDAAEAAAETLEQLDAELADLGIRGRLEPERTGGRRTRSTRRRQDAPELPKKQMAKTTLGRTFTGNGGTVYRPSMFVTVTLPSYGRVDSKTGVPVNAGRYDYQGAARDAIHFSRLLDRLVQNLRRVAGYDVQYFATVEPQRRLAPHAHFATRGVIPRTLLKQVIAATYHQVWWPPTDTPVYTGSTLLPIWDEDAGTIDDCGGYLDPTTGAVLPTFDQALDDLDQDDDGQEVEPQHVVRFGTQADIKGLISGTPEADRRIGYLAKYLTKDIASCHGDTDGDLTVAGHTDRMVEALKYEPCSPTCANWLRYGIQPRNARPGLTPGTCRPRPTTGSTSATAAAASSSAANGPARPSPTTATNAARSSWPSSASTPPPRTRPAPTRPPTATPGNASTPAKHHPWRPGSFTPSPNARPGAPPTNAPATATDRRPSVRP